MKLYKQLADDLTVLIRQGTLKPGDRVPSVRETSRERGMSPATVIHAYELLEGQGLIETRPRSGYYVGTQAAAPAPQPRISRPSPRSTLLDVSELVFEVLESLRNRSVVPMGSAFPSPKLFPLPQARLGAVYERASNGPVEHRRGPSRRQRRASPSDISPLPARRSDSLSRRDHHHRRRARGAKPFSAGPDPARRPGGDRVASVLWLPSGRRGSRAQGYRDPDAPNAWRRYRLPGAHSG